MSINLRLICFGMLAAFVVCGCQSSSGKWTMSSATSQKNSKSPESTAKRLRTKNEIQGKVTDQSKDAVQLADLIEKGDQFRKSGQYEDARFAYGGALSISPDNPDVHHRLAIIADKQQQYSVADQHYQAALLARPKDINLLSDLGYSYTLRGNNPQAEQTLKQALAIDATHRGAMANLGALYAQQNRQSEALAMFRKGSTSEAEAQQNVAKLFARKKGTTQLHASLPTQQNGDELDSPFAADNLTKSDRDTSAANTQKEISQSESVQDLSQLSLEQLQAEMARRERSGKPGRQREKPWDDSDSETEKSEHRQTRPERTASVNPDREVPTGTARSEISRITPDSDIMQARGQTHDDLTDAVHQTSTATVGATPLATRIGMNAGPGNLFPLLTFKNDRFDSAATVNSAASARQPSMAGTANWRNQLQNSVSSSSLDTWDSDLQNDSPNRSQLESGQNATGRVDQTGATRTETSFLNGPRNPSESTRPLKGAWPKTNDIPNRQNQNTSNNGNGRPSNGFEDFSANLSAGNSSGNARVSKGDASNTSPAQWPEAPNR